MKKAVAYTFIFNNQIFVSEDKKAEQNKTLSGLVSICVLFKKLEILAGTSKENLHKLQLY